MRSNERYKKTSSRGKNFNKIKKSKKIRDTDLNAVKKLESETKRLLNKIEKEGYDVSSKKRYRNTKNGEMLIAQLLGGIPGRLTTSMIEALLYKGKYKDEDGFDQRPHIVRGTKYKVKT